jgi:acetoin utilization deacetylase AcuC-like enzyme
VRLVDVASDPGEEGEQSGSASVSGNDANRAAAAPAVVAAGALVAREPFSAEELARARAMLVRAHSEELVSGLEAACRDARQRRVDDGKADPCGHMGYLGGDLDCYVTTESFSVCLRAAASWIRAADVALAQSTPGTVGMAMALTRPPGHHATRTNQNGFCLYNFAAAAALSVLDSSSSLGEAGGAASTPTTTTRTVSVLDFDVHYGQGTADILASNPCARYASVHQTPAFPYQGEALQLSGEHRNVYTIPIPPSTTWGTPSFLFRLAVRSWWSLAH